jgi:glycosyltransferase involved in cell wall biosynthesis
MDHTMTAAPTTTSHIERSGRFSIVIPVYNHGRTVADVVRRSRRWNLPVFVVDDGSTDGGYDTIKSIRGIEVLQHTRNRGKGAALIRGMTEAAKVADWAICLDADGQHDPDQIGVFLSVADADRRHIVVGRRSGMETAPWTSRFGRKFSNFWVRASGGPSIADTQSGFRMYPLPEVIRLSTRARRYQYEVEVLAKARWAGIDTVEVPVRAVYDPQVPRISHFKPWSDFWRNAGTFSRLIFRRIFSPRLWFLTG